MEILNRANQSVCGLDLFLCLSFTGIDSSCHKSNTGHSVLAFLDLCDGNIAGVNWELVGSSIGLVLGDLVNVDRPLLSVDLDDFALVSLSCTSENNNLVVLSDWEGSDSGLGSEGFRESG